MGDDWFEKDFLLLIIKGVKILLLVSYAFEQSRMTTKFCQLSSSTMNDIMYFLCHGWYPKLYYYYSS